MITRFNRHRLQLLWCAAAAWCAVLLVVYLPGISGPLFYDDVAPLNRLAEIERLWSQQALYFVLGEISGPLSRPVAMLSFLPHFDGWPETLPSLLRVNVLIHFCNGLLVFILAWQLLALRPVPKVQPLWGVAAIAAVLWLTLPIHAAAVLIPIQRMALLSTTFVLLGVVGYLAGLHLQVRGYYRSTDVQLAAVLVCLTLAVLSKENGVLLLVLLLVMELTVLQRVPELRRYRWARVGVLALASLAIIGYVLRRLINNPLETLAGRDFSVLERLATQPLVILDYLRQSFVPHWQTITPFQDHWRALDLAQLWGLPGLALLVMLSWLIIAVAARRHWPWFAFGSLWFFGAQLLESTTIGLELSFLHRAYLPLVGLAVLLAVGCGQLFTWAGKRRPLVAVVLVAYLGVLGLTLANITLNWGKPEQAAQVWFDARPASARAAVHLIHQLRANERDPDVLEILEHHLDHCPDCLLTRSLALSVSCQTGNNAAVRRHYTALLDWAPQRNSLRNVGNMIVNYHSALNNEHCAPGSEYTAYALLEEIIATRTRNDRITRELQNRLDLLYLIDSEFGAGMELLLTR